MRLQLLLLRNPFPGEPIHPGPYRLVREADDANVFRVGHPLAQRLMDAARMADTPVSEVTFLYTGSGKNIAAFTGYGGVLDANQCRRLFDLPGMVTGIAEARFAPSLPDKLRLQREVKTLEGRRDEAWRAFDQASRSSRCAGASARDHAADVSTPSTCSDDMSIKS